MLFIIILLVVFVPLMIAITAAAFSDTNDPKHGNYNMNSEALNHYNNGQSYHKQEKYIDAINEFCIAISLDKDCAILYSGLSDAYGGSNNTSKAIECATECLRLDNSLPEGYKSMGFAYLYSGRAEEAKEMFFKALSLRDKYAHAHYGLSMAFCDLGDIESAYQQYLLLSCVDSEMAKFANGFIGSICIEFKKRCETGISNHNSNFIKKDSNQPYTKYFEILGVETSASFDEVKSAYKDMIKVWHPDRFTHDNKLRLKAEEKTKQINDAFKNISLDFNNN